MNFKAIIKEITAALCTRKPNFKSGSEQKKDRWGFSAIFNILSFSWWKMIGGGGVGSLISTQSICHRGAADFNTVKTT